MSKFFKISLVKSLRCRKTVVSAEIHHLLLRRRTTVNNMKNIRIKVKHLYGANFRFYFD